MGERGVSSPVGGVFSSAIVPLLFDQGEVRCLESRNGERLSAGLYRFHVGGATNAVPT